MSDVVLVGGGHAHALVLARWRPLPGVRLTLVSDRERALYSGLVPAVVAGRCAPSEAEIDLPRLAARAGAAFVCATATRIDPLARRIDRSDGAPLAFDLASIDVGSDVPVPAGAGPGETLLATRPLARLLDALPALDASARTRPGGALRIVVLGGGPGGVELALAFHARIAASGARPDVTLVEAGTRLVPGLAAVAARRAAAHLHARGIALRLEARALAVRDGRLRLAGGEALAFDRLVLATGAAAPALVRASPLPTDARGFVRVRDTLEVEGCSGLFAAGDVASLASAPRLPKAGVFAVRAAPTLAHNLRAALAGRALARFRPQRDALAILNLADGTALATKWGLAAEGALVLRWKDRLDRGFVRRLAQA